MKEEPFKKIKEAAENLADITFVDHILIAANNLSVMNPKLAPLIGMYNEYKGALAYQRLEEFYNRLAHEVEVQGIEIGNILGKYNELLSMLLEKTSEGVTREVYKDKRQMYLNYIVYVISEAAENKLAISNAELFLVTLENMTILELKLIKIIKDSGEIQTQEIIIDGVDPYIISGSINNLKNKGLLINSGHISFVSDSSYGLTQASEVDLSEFGKEFIKYCIEESLTKKY